MKYRIILAAFLALAMAPAVEAATKVRVMYTAVAPYASAFIALFPNVTVKVLY